MRLFTRILPIFWISGVLALSACTNRAPSLRLLDTRAAYGSPYDEEEVAIYKKSKAHADAIGLAAGPRVATVYVFPHDLPSQDRFWGCYISVVIRRDEVVFENPEEFEGDQPIDSGPRSKRKQIKPIVEEQ
jgi:hypothetical protein